MTDNDSSPKINSERLHESLVADITEQLDLVRGLEEITQTSTSHHRGYESMVADIATQLDLGAGLASINGEPPSVPQARTAPPDNLLSTLGEEQTSRKDRLS